MRLILRAHLWMQYHCQWWFYTRGEVSRMSMKWSAREAAAWRAANRYRLEANKMRVWAGESYLRGWDDALGQKEDRDDGSR